MKKLTKNIQLKVGSNKGKVSGNLLTKPKTHKSPRVVKAGQTTTGKIKRKVNCLSNQKRNRKYVSKLSSKGLCSMVQEPQPF